MAVQTWADAQAAMASAGNCPFLCLGRPAWPLDARYSNNNNPTTDQTEANPESISKMEG